MDHWLTALKGSRVLVTGGAGLIGSALRRTLETAAASVTVLDNLSGYDRATLALLGVDDHDPSLKVGDICDEDLVRVLVDESDYVIHAAAYSTVAGCTRDPATAFHSNIAGTETVLRAVARSRHVRRFAFISSAQVYGHGTAGSDAVQVFSEDQPYSPLNLYAAAKAWGEWQTRFLLGSAQVDHVVLRPFSVYGEGQIPKPGAYSWVIAQFAMYATIGQRLPLNNGGRQVRDFLHVEDVATAICRALTADTASGKTINLGTGRVTPVRRVAELVRAHFPDAQFQDAPRPAQDPLGGCADIACMTEVLGWEPQITVENGIARYVEWLRAVPAAIPDWLRSERDRIASWNGAPVPRSAAEDR
ncbi:NAD-dependent epimerase/dehydratase family protein [Microbispora sp. H10885]|uniref:NAD-dependent epimerase/dehydratase family protein n=1 Tax=Microbispora sp. H10885 TaxID=2729110 RepID=UPI0015FF4F5A|nr:NAD-dependent epimerase/dehydratase family protein [Microbispora sp. H10885]